MDVYTPDLPELMQLVEQGYLTYQVHPNGRLAVLNYTHKTTTKEHWIPATLACRGLIIDRESGAVVARPFPKFFNVGERMSQVPDEPFEIYEKLDGSLGIAYHDGERWAIATRGSFRSEQAIAATELLHSKYPGVLRWMFPEVTYLFEIILPWNRIVVDYGGVEELVLLASINTKHGIETKPQYSDVSYGTNLRAVATHPHTDLEALLSEDRPNAEGYVLRFASGLRLKVKHETYRRLHRLLTGTSTKAIWEILRDGGTPESLRGWYLAPTEWTDWAMAHAETLRSEYEAIRKQSFRDWAQVKTMLRCENVVFARAVIAFNPTYRALAASFIKRMNYPSVLFAMLDNKPYDHIIWGMLKPAGARPWKNEPE
jgi:RNA ligase